MIIKRISIAAAIGAAMLIVGHRPMKKAIKKVSLTLGYEVHKSQPKPYVPSPPDDSILTDDIVQGPWVSGVLQMSNRYYRPPVLQHYGSKFGEDTRLKYITDFLDVRDQRILEIGPLEAYYSILLEKMGVRENVAIEARAINVQKCQRIKEIYHLDRTQFVQADLELLYSGEMYLL